MPWFGMVPTHWDVTRLKQICRFAYGDALPNDARQDGEVPVYGSNGRVGTHNFANTTSPCIVIGRKGSFGKVNYSLEPAFAIDTTFVIDQRFTGANLRWLYYLLGWLRLDEVSKDSAIPGLDREDAYQRLAPYPVSIEEQGRIARFLDQADWRINRYIRAKRRLIELLNEQKQAIIHQAVTRGLDPNVRLKPSGVEWLGDIPEHWEVSRLKFEATHIVDCLHATPEYVEDGDYPAIRTADIEPGRVRLNTVRRVARDQYLLWTARLVPQAGDILYSREGERYGIAATVPQSVALCISQRMMIFRIASEHCGEFFMWQMNCPHVYAQAAADQIGATAPHVNVETIRNYEVLVPPRVEQDSIARWISRESARIDAAASDLYREIGLIREYRTRLIADVVTGKLDVRGVELPDLDEDEPLADLDLDDVVDADGDLDDEELDDAAE